MKHECTIKQADTQRPDMSEFLRAHGYTTHDYMRLLLLERHLDALGVVGEVAVLRVGLGAASIANGGADHAREAPERRLRPPEAAQREHRRGRRSPARQHRSPDGAAATREARARDPRDEEDEQPCDGRDGGGGRCHGVGRRSGSGRCVTNRRVGWVVCCSSVWDYSKGRSDGWWWWAGRQLGRLDRLMGLKATFGPNEEKERPLRFNS